MANIKHMEAVFENGDKLILTLREGTKFAGHKPATLYELFYSERVEGNHESVSDDEPISEDPHFYYVHQTEYFPKTEFGKAMSAFNTRLTCNNPRNESDQGFNLNQLLEKN